MGSITQLTIPSLKTPKITVSITFLIRSLIIGEGITISTQSPQLSRFIIVKHPASANVNNVSSRRWDAVDDGPGTRVTLHDVVFPFHSQWHVSSPVGWNELIRERHNPCRLEHGNIVQPWYSPRSLVSCGPSIAEETVVYLHVLWPILRLPTCGEQSLG